MQEKLHLDLYPGLVSSRGSLQSSRENMSELKFFNFSIFCLPHLNRIHNSEKRYVSWFLFCGVHQCYGSESRILCLFDPWIRDLAWLTKSGSGSGMNNPDHISESLENNFLIKILQFFDANPRSGMVKNSDPERINIPDPLHCLRMNM